MQKEKQILHAWQRNSQPWGELIEHNEIASRQLATNKAIVSAVLAGQPTRILDLGCGEGWLVRMLSAKGISGVGLDGSEGLIEQAKQKGGGEFYLLPYEEFAANMKDQFGSFDCLIFNYSLFGKELVARVLSAVRPLLSPAGCLLIQTIHPQHPAMADRQESGWVLEDGSGFPRPFTEPYEWYFRTMNDWEKLFESTAYSLAEARDVVHPDSKEMISVVFVLEPS